MRARTHFCYLSPHPLRAIVEGSGITGTIPFRVFELSSKLYEKQSTHWAPMYSCTASRKGGVRYRLINSTLYAPQKIQN